MAKLTKMIAQPTNKIGDIKGVRSGIIVGLSRQSLGTFALFHRKFAQNAPDHATLGVLCVHDGL